ncbi:MAG: hypothetical protein ACRDQB_05195 [Thermocrispum sp.]
MAYGDAAGPRAHRAGEYRAVRSRDEESSVDVADAPDAQRLWRLLVTVTGGRELATAVAVDAFRRLHDAGQPEPVDSALLLCTDWRWRRTSARVLAGVVGTGILDDGGLDRLAEELLWSDMVRYVHPLGWIGSTFIEFDLGAPQQRRAPRQRKVHVDPSTPVTTERHVWPPLRSWAAERVLVRNRAAPADVLARAHALPARDGAAVVTGAVHAADELDPEQARMVVDVALRWGHKAPRKAALERLTAWGEADRAQALAAGDPDAAIRAWGRKLDTEIATQSSLFD